MKISWISRGKYGNAADPETFEQIVSRMFKPVEAPEDAKVFILNTHGVELDKRAIKREIGSIEEPSLGIVLWAALPGWERSTITKLFGHSLPGGTRDCHKPLIIRNGVALKDDAGTTFGLWDKTSRLALIFFDLVHNSSMFHRLVPSVMEKIIEVVFNPNKEQWKKITMATIDNSARSECIEKMESEIERLQTTLSNRYERLYREVAINKAGKKIVNGAIEQLLKSDDIVDAYARPSGIYLNTKKGKLCLAISGDTVEVFKEERKKRLLFPAASAEALAKLLAFGQYDTFVKLALELL